MLVRRRKTATLASMLFTCIAIPAHAQILYPTHTLADPRPVAGNEFGRTTAISDGIVVISAPGDDTMGQNAGVIHLYSYQASQWLYTQSIYPIAGAAGDQFGEKIALDGQRLITGNRYSDIYGPNAGLAVIYRHHNGAWAIEGILVPPSPSTEEEFGKGVAIRGDLAVVFSTRAVHVYRHSNGQWAFEQIISDSKHLPGPIFFDSKSDRFAVRALLGYQMFGLMFYARDAQTSTWSYQSSLKLPITGESSMVREASIEGSRMAACVFQSPVGAHVKVYQEDSKHNWNATAEIFLGAGPQPNFGDPVKLRGDVIIAGDSAISGYFLGERGPAAYARFNGAAWERAAQLLNADWIPTDKAHVTDFFGNTAVVGAYNDNVNGIASGAAYIYNLTCVGDFDSTGFVDTDDYDAFVHAFIGADPAADVDHSGFVDTDDFTFFVNQFELGC